MHASGTKSTFLLKKTCFFTQKSVVFLIKTCSWWIRISFKHNLFIQQNSPWPGASSVGGSDADTVLPNTVPAVFHLGRSCSAPDRVVLAFSQGPSVVCSSLAWPRRHIKAAQEMLLCIFSVFPSFFFTLSRQSGMKHFLLHHYQLQKLKETSSASGIQPRWIRPCFFFLLAGLVILVLQDQRKKHALYWKI